MLLTSTFLCRAEGAAGFFKGLSPTLVQILPYMSLQFYLYEASSSIFKRISAARQVSFVRCLSSERENYSERAPSDCI